MASTPFFLFISPERNCSSFYAMHSLVFVMRSPTRTLWDTHQPFQVCARPALRVGGLALSLSKGSSAGLAIPSFEGMQAKGHNFLTSVNFSRGSKSEVKPPTAWAKLRPSLLAHTPRGWLLLACASPTKLTFGGFWPTAKGV